MTKTLIGQIDKILFEEDGFFIAVLKSGEKISGSYYESAVSHLKDSAVTLKGHWDEHKKYGKTFKFEYIKVNQNELFFFLNKIIKGFTKKLTAELIEHFGNDGLVEILDNDIERLLEFSGIKEKKLKKIQASWKKFRSMRRIGEFLAPYNVTPALLTTIATAMRDVEEPCEKIKNNPYILTSINSIGFKRADELALKMGVKKDDENRISSAMDYLLLNYCEQQGNSCVAKEILFGELDALLLFSDKNYLYEAILVERVSEGSIVLMKNNRLSPARLYDAEKFLYDEFKRRATLDNGGFVKDLDEFLKESQLQLGEQQKEAVQKINDGASLLFLVGYAGTGKSTTSRTILNLLNTKYDKKEIITCALSGIASQRIADTTGYESATIQSLLVKFEDRDEFPYSVVLIDEASMINSSLFARLIRKVSKNAVLIVVGDDAQLPPIGAGNILSDVLTLSLAPIVKLTKIYRQSEDKAITVIANDVRTGVVPEYKREYEDFEFIDISMQNYYALKNQLSQKELQEFREENSAQIVAQIAHKVVESIFADKEQIDRPDKAIILEKNNAKIGIEITCIDNKDVLKYFNDEKITNKILNEQLSNIDGSYEYCENPVKKLSIPYPHTYIYDGVIKKEEKFSDYQKSDNYEEIIILAFTNYLKLENVKGIDYFTEWTQYLLSKEHFLFNNNFEKSHWSLADGMNRNTTLG